MARNPNQPPNSKIAVYPGSFDPFTNGHLDVVDRALAIFDTVIVAVAANPEKRQPLFTVEERLDLIRASVTGRDRVEVASYRGLTVEYARSRGARTLVKGLPQAGARRPHRLLDVQLRAHLRLVKYLEGHRKLWRQGLRPGAAASREGVEGEVQIKVDELLDRIEYLIQNARHVPLSTQVMVNEDEMMELIDQIRFNLPDEIKQANWTVSEQQRIMTEAHAEAARTMSRANERAEETASEHEILRRAERHSAQVVKDAQTKADQIVRDAEGYALEQLKQLEAHLGRTLQTVRRGVEALQQNQPANGETADQAAER